MLGVLKKNESQTEKLYLMQFKLNFLMFMLDIDKDKRGQSRQMMNDDRLYVHQSRRQVDTNDNVNTPCDKYW